MKCAIYSRKSKFTGIGDSVENQIQLCKEYAINTFHLSNRDFIIYEDEGFSGGSMDRPEFQKMLLDAKLKSFNMIICYRLDRISRNVADFSFLIEELSNYNISFISIKENFDTSTPMGRAMMYIASVFAQLERETIGERIRDNMLQLAKDGHWLGGICPTGFKSTCVTIRDEKDKTRKIHILESIPKEIYTVRLIFNKFLDLKSLTQLEIYCIDKNIKSKNNINFSPITLRNILSNPVYAVADSNIYAYFITNKYSVYGSRNLFNNKHGIMAYNKTIQKKNYGPKLRDPSQWVITVGSHDGIIPSQKWITVQNILSKNTFKSFRRRKSSQALLSGILYCKTCGSRMRPKIGRTNKNGFKTFYYICENKIKSKKSNCSIKNIQGNELDKALLENIKNNFRENPIFMDAVGKSDFTFTRTKKNSNLNLLKKIIEKKKFQIQQLVQSISYTEEESIKKYIFKEIKTLEEDLNELECKYKILYNKLNTQSSKFNIGHLVNTLGNFHKLIDLLSNVEKTDLINSLIEKVIWDGNTVEVVFVGSTKKKRFM
ncbi:MAG: recombinase family protein [Anaeromicrobium sp.]|jgi:site-specific DNA recombinase|uniref:recombinase family protein n=1 Tax=Anaeromicrobium sp. TaxID=1929132 RepID=UPI0025E14138|nr:recombinase family protein [Anaeromicrobium sp.]MCT4595056.1 recombinase family protein [Anaeromicrobium sp.]